MVSKPADYILLQASGLLAGNQDARKAVGRSETMLTWPPQIIRRPEEN